MVALHCHHGVKPPMHSGSYSRCLVCKPRWAWCINSSALQRATLGGNCRIHTATVFSRCYEEELFLCTQPQSPAVVCTATLMADRAVGLTPATVSLKSKHTLCTTVQYGIYWSVLEILCICMDLNG